MVACADDSLSRSGQRGGRRDDRIGEEGEEEDPSTMIAADPDTTTTNTELDGVNWPTAEGYTPLGDMLSFGSILVAMPPDDDDNDSDEGEDNGTTEFRSFPAGSNAFVADPNALFGTEAFPEDNDNDNHDNDSELNEFSTDIDVNNDNDANFREVANTALMALENEYMATISMPPLGPPTLPPENTAGNTTSSTELENPNFADFGSLPLQLPKKENPPIDTLAVAKAMSGINAAGLGEKLQKKKGSFPIETKRPAIREHSVIPAAPLKAFRKCTPKAIQATANLTRAATIADCLHRLSYLLQCQERLSIHVVGADHVECQSQDRVRSLFSPLARWIGNNIYSPRTLSITLVGPNVPSSMAASSSPSNPIDLHLTTAASSTSEYRRLLSAVATCHEASYHEWLEQQLQLKEENNNEGDLPDLVVCFNAGIWGYDEWKPTIRKLIDIPSRMIPFVVTSYTAEEGEDDYDVIEELVKATADTDANAAKRICLWGPAENLFASKQKRETLTAPEGRDYRENNAWQAWRL